MTRSTEAMDLHLTDPRETLARIREQADAATPGPWKVDTADPDTLAVTTPGVLPDMGMAFLDRRDESSAEFIAAARTDVPRLVAALRSVLEIHTEKPHGCAVCEEQDQALPWPCPTVTAITTALNGDTP